jgi:NAD dependent epimerase/dehydratase
MTVSTLRKKALVTGADGFIGSHLVETLLSNNFDVRALCLYNSFNFWGWLDGYQHPNLEIVTGDIRDYHYCLQITQGVDIVFHLGALIAIPYSYHSPESYIDTNIKGTSNVCLASLYNKVGRVIHTSTSEVYGTARYVPIDEKHPLQPQSPYSASKIGADSMALSFYNAFNLPVVIARPFNTYGPRQSARAIIPTIITQLANGIKEIKLGDLSPTRDLNYVLDTCKGFLDIANASNVDGEVINIGSNYEITMKTVFETIRDIMQVDAIVVEDAQRIRPEKSEVFRLWCDNTKIHELTGFKPEFSIRTGLQETIKWFLNKENLKKYKANIYNV